MGFDSRPATFGVCVFLGALLLFQVQPMVAKAITPTFGGSSMVWTTCMVFFQASLLAGYLYAHLLTRLRFGAQAAIHVALMCGALLTVDLIPTTDGFVASRDPVFSLISLLSTTVGPPFLLVSATAPLIQQWFAATYHRSPYRLYALSNTGSLLGLLCYPVVVEPFFKLQTQAFAWKTGFICLAAFFAFLGLTLSNKPYPACIPSAELNDVDRRRPSFATYLTWLLLAAVPSALLLAVTNKIGVEIAPVPMLWVVPLSLYLLTFIVSFDHDSWYRPTTTLVFAIISVVAVGLFLHQRNPHILMLIGSMYAATFFGSLLCHGELSSLKPSPTWLTSYFLTISTGGVLGGLCVAVFAPRLFDSYHELPIAFAACLSLFIVVHRFPWSSQWYDRPAVKLSIALSAGMATIVWTSPELQTIVFRFAVARPGRAIELTSVLAPLVLLLAAFFRLVEYLVDTRSKDAANEHTAVRDRTPIRSLVMVSAVTVGTLCAAVLCLAISAAGMGWKANGESTTSVSLANPVAIWGLCFVVCCTSASRFKRDSWKQELGTGLTELTRSTMEFVLPMLFATATAALLAKTCVEALIAVPLGRWLLLIPAIAIALNYFPMFRIATSKQRRIACMGMLIFSMLPALLGFRGVQLQYGSAGSMAVATTLLVLCIVVSAVYLNPPTNRSRLSTCGFLSGLPLGAILMFYSPDLVAESVVPACSALASLVLITDLLLAAPNGFPLVASAITVGIVGISCGMTFSQQRHHGRILAAARNFYGVLRVEEIAAQSPVRLLLHGNVTHGSQNLIADKRLEPTTYYHRKSGVGMLLELPSERPREVALIGLGIGTLAAYGRPGDHFHFIEIDPKVLQLAQQYFGFLDSSEAKLDFTIADGRLALEENPSTYDILIVDAFAGDAIPMHLLTEEAIGLYLSRLKKDGVIAIHLSNSHIDLTPVVNAHARKQQLNVKYIDYNEPGELPRSLWAILSKAEVPIVATIASDAVSQREILWTDQQHGLLRLIRIGR